MTRRVVVTGMGVLAPVGLNLTQAWATITSGKSGISQLEGPAYAPLPCRIAGLIKEKGARIDLTSRFKKTELKSMGAATAYALLAAHEALTDSGLVSPPDSVKLRTGVAVGMGMVDLEDICATSDALKRGYNQVSPFFVPRILPNMCAGQISIKYGFRGPNHAVSTACATGAHAIGDSFRFIRHGDADVMVCGGAEACISPLAIAAFCRLRALSTGFNDSPQKGSRPFDKARDGFVMGEGSAILILEELQHAKDRGAKIYAEILGYGLSGDASHLTAPRSDGTGAILAMSRAVEDAGVDKGAVGYINAHATSTPIGDAIETTAIKTLFKDYLGPNFAVSSTKGAHGHLLGAAGNLETVFTVKAVEEGVLPPTINLENCEDSSLNFVPNQSQPWAPTSPRVALKNAFGFGGTNACLCISQFVN
ncbi:3-oxoacyl-[acyl-carrier-protein] synthase, mitochondrial [Tribolium castaneum]|uniref:3-oxoacyl-[acyl-carrier-protein] synthase n=1 Tax=Tribolium castaneum TaxID=7070 RepID=D6X1D1_TRICA|nr:PREDICTED: 3-oxoacyl-[acyl-carrier-protein] synthase, mitochondrial [Tribolium castaneum]XP_015839091.1 PREDICTED: 3-oxoacyl-[acyl-carrier-protein] synthase, mitochondrial [Tribolium castaneum]EFA09506.1 3-oxoacyl-[acyl-carrier-protein] synthase, mitochondrial-like Protein [Tribolium castaneum]|eukprot:XP_008198523.1 PREDICTED: 3-oxoacyl-[acyl-carrier-protein] synthase, mitochondrial [Tribolium castaneum]